MYLSEKERRGEEVVALALWTRKVPEDGTEGFRVFVAVEGGRVEGRRRCGWWVIG